jgi:hypothetical protein
MNDQKNADCIKSFAFPNCRCRSNHQISFRRRTLRLATTTGLLSGCAALLLSAASVQADMSVKLEPLVTAVNTPLAVVQPKGDDRLFVIEQFGRVRIIKNGELLAEPFLDIRNKIPKSVLGFRRAWTAGYHLPPELREQRPILRGLQCAPEFSG